MDLIETQAAISSEPQCREMNRWEAIKSRLGHWLRRQRRKLPFLVWYDDELDVTVTFSSAKLKEGATLEEAMTYLFSHELAGIEDALSKIGVSFDRGGGFSGRDWEWDWSLKGPISIRFRGAARNPEFRKERPRPHLIFSKQKG